MFVAEPEYVYTGESNSTHRHPLKTSSRPRSTLELASLRPLKSFMWSLLVVRVSAAFLCVRRDSRR